jgi:hypothetical protein
MRDGFFIFAQVSLRFVTCNLLRLNRHISQPLSSLTTSTNTNWYEKMLVGYRQSFPAYFSGEAPALNLQ